MLSVPGPQTELFAKNNHMPLVYLEVLVSQNVGQACEIGQAGAHMTGVSCGWLRSLQGEGCAWLSWPFSVYLVHVY